MTTFPVPPCPHPARLYLPGARECAACWIARMEAEDAQTAAADEVLPFDGPVQDDEYAGAAMYAAPRKGKSKKAVR